MALRAGLATALALLTGLLAAPAHAGTVRLTTDPEFPPEQPRFNLAYEAGAEPNDVRIWTTDAEAWNFRSVWIRDAAGLIPGDGCSRGADADPAVVVCQLDPPASLRSVSVAVGGGHDSVVVEDIFSLRVSLAGGPGDDTLRGAPAGENRFLGGAGNDLMIGGALYDLFDEGPRADGHDTMIGGGNPEWAGLDWVDYGERSAEVRADLEGDRDDGELGERDRIAADVDGLIGGAGADTLRGHSRANSLYGGPGPDELYGAPGDDVLVGDRGRDQLHGGKGLDDLQGGGGADLLAAGPDPDSVEAGLGADLVLARDEALDAVWCRSGRDRLRQDRLDFHIGCERHAAQVDGAVPAALTVYQGRPGWYVDLVVGCPGRPLRPCEGTVRLQLDGRTQAAIPFGENDSRSPSRIEQAPVSDSVGRAIEARAPGFVLVIVTRKPGRDRVVRVAVSRVRTALGEVY